MSWDDCTWEERVQLFSQLMEAWGTYDAGFNVGLAFETLRQAGLEGDSFRLAVEMTGDLGKDRKAAEKAVLLLERPEGTGVRSLPQEEQLETIRRLSRLHDEPDKLKVLVSGLEGDDPGAVRTQIDLMMQSSFYGRLKRPDDIVRATRGLWRSGATPDRLATLAEEGIRQGSADELLESIAFMCKGAGHRGDWQGFREQVGGRVYREEERREKLWEALDTIPRGPQARSVAVVVGQAVEKRDAGEAVSHALRDLGKNPDAGNAVLRALETTISIKKKVGDHLRFRLGDIYEVCRRRPEEDVDTLVEQIQAALTGNKVLDGDASEALRHLWPADGDQKIVEADGEVPIGHVAIKKRS